MAAVRAPAAAHGEDLLARVGQAVRDGARNVVERAALHLLRPAVSLFVHQDERAAAGDAEVILRRVALGVEVSLGHEVFVAHLAGVDKARPEQQAAGRSLRLLVVHLHAVDDCILRQGRAGRLIRKEPRKVGDSPLGGRHFPGETSRCKVDGGLHLSPSSSFFRLLVYSRSHLASSAQNSPLHPAKNAL